MAGIGRPKGQRGHNPIRYDAMKIFSEWRHAGEPLTISSERAFELSEGVVDVRGEKEIVPLSSVALRVSVYWHKRK